jgi:hypothetical protein
MPTLRLYIPVDLEIPQDHVDMVLSDDWASTFYDFDGPLHFALYAARLMTVAGLPVYDSPVVTAPLTRFDGHATGLSEDACVLRLAPADDLGWSMGSLLEFAENIPAS